MSKAPIILDLPGIITLDELAEALRIPPTTARGLCRDKKIRATKVGKHWRVARVDLEKYFNYHPLKREVVEWDCPICGKSFILSSPQGFGLCRSNHLRSHKVKCDSN